MSDNFTPRRIAKRLLLQTGTYGSYWRARELSHRWNPRTTYGNLKWKLAHRGQIPVPPPGLMFAVANRCDIAGFVASGATQARFIVSILERAGLRFADRRRVLDFGCGCGRVLRHFASLEGCELHGCDYNPKLVAWCAHHLKFAKFATNGLQPPLPYADGSFDLVYAISVFTHLDEDLCVRWLRELRRVLSADGTLLLTTHGESCFRPIDREESRRWASGMVVMRSVRSAGANICEAYHPPSAFREIASREFPSISHFPQGDRDIRDQDYWVLGAGVAVSGPPVPVG